MKIIASLVAVFVILAYSALHAQSYSVTASVEDYSELKDGDTITTTFPSLGYRLLFPFVIKPYGITYNLSRDTGMIVSYSGYIEGIHAATDTAFVIYPLFAKMGRLDSRSAVSYSITGPIGSRILKIEWRNLALLGNPEGDSANVQLWLLENSADFEVHVGPILVNSSVAFSGREGPAIGVGIANANATIWYRAHSLGWDGQHLSSDTTTALSAMHATPAANTVYHFHYGAPAEVAGIGVAGDGAVRFLPNPGTGRTRMVVPDVLAAKHGQVVIYDQIGRDVMRADGLLRDMTIDTGNLPAGVYHCMIVAEGRRYPAVPLIVR